jgi:hypothetical protein
MRTNTHFLPYVAQFFSEYEMFQTQIVEKLKKHIFCSFFF